MSKNEENEKRYKEGFNSWVHDKYTKKLLGVLESDKESMEKGLISLICETDLEKMDDSYIRLLVFHRASITAIESLIDYICFEMENDYDE